MIDLLIDEGPQKCGEHDVDVIKALYIRGLVYLDVPIDDNDHISGELTITQIIGLNYRVQALCARIRNRVYAISSLTTAPDLQCHLWRVS